MIDAPKTKPDRGLKSVPKVPKGNVCKKYTSNNLALITWRHIRTWPSYILLLFLAKKLKGSIGLNRSQ